MTRPDFFLAVFTTLFTKALDTRNGYIAPTIYDAERWAKREALTMMDQFNKKEFEKGEVIDGNWDSDSHEGAGQT